MTTRTALATLADLLPDPAEPIDFAALRADIDKARREFTEEELTPAEHAARLAAAHVLAAAHPYRYEFTDTFSGEANYSWARRGVTYARTMEQATRHAKAALGLNGHRCRRHDFSDQVALYPAGTCTVLFVTEA
jgi:hypothetical protein